MVKFMHMSRKREGRYQEYAAVDEKLFYENEFAEKNTGVQRTAFCHALFNFILADYFFRADGGEPEIKSFQAFNLKPN